MKRRRAKAEGSKAQPVSKPAAASSSREAGRGEPLPPSRRWLFRLLAATAVPLLLVLFLEGVLRVLGYGYDPRFFVPLDIGGERFLVQNEDFSRRFFPPETLRHPGALRMKAAKPPGAVRIFVLGESAAMGDPEPAFGPARYMESLLAQRHPGTDFEVINVAFTAINSHVILPIARECAQHEGDVWIVYMGNNEMVGPYGASSAFGSQAPPLGQVRAALALQSWRLGQLLHDVGRRLRGGSSDYASWGGMQMFLENQVAADDPRRQLVRDHFRRNLEDILHAGRQGGATVLLNTVAVNLKDCPPFASLLATNLTPAEQASFERHMARARIARAQTNHLAALEAFQAASALDPHHAALHYEWGQTLLEMDQVAAARAQFQQACDADALAFRTDSPLNQIIGDTAPLTAPEGGRLVDAVTALEGFSPEGIVGDESFYEHVHFNFDGAYRLGLVWATNVAEVLGARLPPAQAQWATQADCEQWLGLSDWNRKFVVESMIRRLQQPPLNNQANNGLRLERLRQRERELLAGMNRSAAEAARTHFLGLLAERPSDHFIFEAYGGFLQAIGDKAGATEAWRKVGELFPHDFLPWFQMGVLLDRQGLHAEAQHSLRRALAIRPSLVEGWSELGQSHGAARQWAEALACFERACQMRPQDPVLWAYQAKVLAEMGRRAEAIPVYRRAIEINPGYADAHGAVGDLLAQAEQWTEALREYERVLALQPKDVTAHFNRGVMLLRLGRMAEGEQAFRRVLELDANHVPAREYVQRLQTAAPATQ